MNAICSQAGILMFVFKTCTSDCHDSIVQIVHVGINVFVFVVSNISRENFSETTSTGSSEKSELDSRMSVKESYKKV